MAIKCPDCGCWNDSEQIFCKECGEPIDPKTRLIMELEGKKATTQSNHASTLKDEDDDDDTDAFLHSYERETKKSPVGWILALTAAAAAAYFLFLR